MHVFLVITLLGKGSVLKQDFFWPSHASLKVPLFHSGTCLQVPLASR